MCFDGLDFIQRQPILQGTFLKDLAVAPDTSQMQDWLANVAIQAELKMGFERVLDVPLLQDPLLVEQNERAKSKS